MKRVECVESYYDQITVGRVYEVVDEWVGFYQIKNNSGLIVGHSKCRFVEVVPTYQLNLSEEEKDVLICILGSISGCPTNSPRKFADSIYEQLEKNKTVSADPYYSGYSDLIVKYQDLMKDPDATIMFDNFPPEPVKTEPVKNTLTLKAKIDTSDAKKDIEELAELLKQVEAIKNRIFKEGV